ncbi:hypothetical protein [Saccharibacillus kuerlensis]|uniref:DUF4367 domain-containing protein n=1 Tax=Saccharibacillus kuerlensis TaxID=459527 RepID=A0ABQ2LB25_9BACL|nr:hypothetical protein [Saccharibacillus kuerlensis]GGO08908.1 hypothetical protein GCM10010969_38800 [Saccharibacillus kuerlensis]
MMKKKTVGFVLLIVLLLTLTACGKPAWIGNQKAEPLEGTEQLFDLKAYDPEEQVELSWEGQKMTGTFERHPTLPIGVYLPQGASAFKMGNDTAWGFQSKQIFMSVTKNSLIDASLMRDRTEEVAGYKEYRGSINDGRIADFFQVEHDGETYIVSFTYLDKAKALPLLIDMAKSLRITE